MKVCRKCLMERELSQFRAKAATCRLCMNERDRIKYFEGKEIPTKRNFGPIFRCRTCLMEGKKEIFIKGRCRPCFNASKRKIKTIKVDIKSCKVCLKDQEQVKFHGNYCLSCYRKTRKSYTQQYYQDKYQTNIMFKLRLNISNAIRKKINKNKESSWKYLSYSNLELKQHLESLFESWMTWDNWGSYSAQTWNDQDQSTWTWQIDHIIPHSKIPYSSMLDDNFKICWQLSNLRPLSAKQNVIDSNRR